MLSERKRKSLEGRILFLENLINLYKEGIKDCITLKRDLEGKLND